MAESTASTAQREKKGPKLSNYYICSSSLPRDFSKQSNNKVIRMPNCGIRGQTFIPLKSEADVLNSASIWPLKLFKYLRFK